MHAFSAQTSCLAATNLAVFVLIRVAQHLRVKCKLVEQQPGRAEDVGFALDDFLDLSLIVSAVNLAGVTTETRVIVPGSSWSHQ